VTTHLRRRTVISPLREFALLHAAAAVLLTALSLSPASADAVKDCQAAQIAACTELLEINSSNTTALANRGVGYRIAGQYDRAIADFDAAIGLDPRVAGYYLERGLARGAKGDHQSAIDDFGAAIGRDATLIPAYFGRAMAFEALGKKDAATEDVNKAIGLNPVLVAALYMQRGNELQKSRRDDEAIAAFDRSIALKSDWPLAYFGRAAAFDDKGNSERAAADYRQCVALNATTDLERQRQQQARERLTTLSRH
jgi:tetratricopeptide (TPR) repeat protein